MKLIEDKLIDPYIIEMDKRNYLVSLPTRDKAGELKTDKNGEIIKSQEGYYTSLAGAINKIVRLKGYRYGKKSQTLAEYVKTYCDGIESIKTALKPVDEGRVQ